MGHDDLTPVAERHVPTAGQLIQAFGDFLCPGAELPRELIGARRTSGLGKRAVHRQPQILSVHGAIFAKPMSLPAARRLSK